jgi:hypothetical protein
MEGMAVFWLRDVGKAEDWEKLVECGVTVFGRLDMYVHFRVWTFGFFEARVRVVGRSELEID